MNEEMKGNLNGRIRYDDVFKQGDLKMIAPQKMPMKQVFEEFGITLVEKIRLESCL